MATSSSKYLSCSICSNPFTDPRLLPCLHVYCKSCLESLESQNEGTLTCLSCYKTSTCSPSQLPRHLRMEREVSLLKLQEPGEMVCSMCDDNNKVVSYCEDCSSPICSDCVSSHKLLKGHSVVPLESAKPQPPPVTCDIHPKEGLKYYCNSCSFLICNECIVDHKYHKWIPIDEAASTEKEDLKLLLSKIKKSISPATEAIQNIDGVVHVVAESKKKIKEDVDKAFKELAAAVERRHKELLKELEDSVIAKTTQLEMQKEELERITAGLQLALTTASSACDDYSSVEVLAVKRSIQRASDDFIKCLGSSLLPVCSGGPDLELDPLLVDAISSLGKVHTVSQYPPLCSLIDVNPEVAIGVATNCDCLLTLQTRNSRGEDLREGGARVDAKIDAPHFCFDCKVCDLDDGKYEILFICSYPMVFDLHIKVNDVAVKGSPYKINFIDYCSIVSPSRTISTDYAPQYIAGYGSNYLFLSTNQGHIEIYERSNGTSTRFVKDREIPMSKLRSVNHLRGIIIDEMSGVLFVASAGANIVIKADLSGSVIDTVGNKESDGFKFQYPTGLCLTKEGLLLVGDCGNDRVQVLGPDLSFIRSINCRARVWGVSVDPGGNVHVGTTSCVEVFKMGGKKITEYGQQHFYKAGDIQFPNFQKPSDCKYSFVTHCVRDGEIYFYNWTTDMVLHKFDVFGHPLGLWINQAGGLYACCFNSQKLHSFTDV